MLAIETVDGTEEATNAGIPSAAATLFLGRTGIIRFKGSTPLGTSAGVDEAIHYVDSIVVPGDLTRKHPELFTETGDGTLRFAKKVDAAGVAAKNDPALSELWKRSRRYGGKGCMEAVLHIETVLAGAFQGKKLAELGSLLEVDRTLLRLEKDSAQQAGRLAKTATPAEQIQAMQRKGVLGMNAILSMSLALGRAVAARDGKELWQLIRSMAAETMAKFVAANAKDGVKEVAALGAMKFDDLRVRYQQVAAETIKDGKTVYELLRAQLPVYDTN